MDPRAARATCRPPARCPCRGQESVPVHAPGGRGAASAPRGCRRPATGSHGPGRYLAYEESGRERRASLEQEWTRIGRSLAADVRFDDATVSRRHALVVSQAEGVRVLDDRSLNGVYVNGERVEWAPLSDGDEITIGRHAIYFLDAVTAGSAAPQTALAD